MDVTNSGSNAGNGCSDSVIEEEFLDQLDDCYLLMNDFVVKFLCTFFYFGRTLLFCTSADERRGTAILI